MSNWDLVMPGAGLTAIGMAGVVVSYSGIAHTFIDGMHALTGLTMFIGLIILSGGILEGGVSTSNRTKAVALVVISIVLGFGAAGFAFSESETLPTFAGILIMIAVPGIMMAYFSMKMPQYAKPVGVIYAIAVGVGIVAFIGFGFVNPANVVIEDAVESTEQIPDGPIYSISILAGSAEQGNPDYEPDVATITQGHVIEWTNHDEAAHTVTSSLDFGETFDSGLLGQEAVFQIDSNKLDIGSYEYLCIVHPWMVSSIIIDEPVE